MKRCTLSVVCLFLSVTSTALSQAGATAESITIHPGSVNAHTYYHCRVLKVEHDGVRVAHDKGITHIPRKFMPPEWLLPTGAPQLPAQQPPIQPPQSLLSQLQPPPGQDLVPSAPRTEPTPSDDPNVSIPFGYFIPLNLADLRVDSPKGWLDGVTSMDGQVYIPNMASRCPIFHNITGWYKNLRLGPNLHRVPFYVDLLFRSIEFKMLRAIDVDGWCRWHVNQGMATEAQTAEWKRLVSEERICVGMPIEISGLVFGHASIMTSVGEGMITFSNNQHWRVYYRNDEPDKNRPPRYRVVKWEKQDTPSPSQNTTVAPPASTSTPLIPSS